jgi:hypothetical protein
VQDQTSVSQEHTNVIESLRDRSSKLLTVTIPLLTLLLGGAVFDHFANPSVDGLTRNLYAAAVVMGVLAGLAGLGTVNWESTYDRVQTLYRIQIATLVGLLLFLAVAAVILIISPNGEVERAAEDYYYAVDREDWDYTFNHLDAESQDLFSRAEWRKKNRDIAKDEGLELSRMEVEVIGSSLGGEVDVQVKRWFKDGDYLRRYTVFVREDGLWKHHLTEEEKSFYR